MQISIKSDIDKLIKDLDGVQKKQIPFATSLALNETAKHGQREAVRQMGKRLDRPTAFTLKGVAIKRSSKRNLVSAVFIKDIQAAYLEPQISGGTVNKTIAQPVEIRLNKYGNIPSMRQGKKIASLLSRSDTFASKIGNVSGVWQRTKRSGLKLLIRFVEHQTYTARYPFERIVQAEVKKQISPAMRKALARALNTAKPNA